MIKRYRWTLLLCSLILGFGQLNSSAQSIEKLSSKSQLLETSGTAKVGAKMPFFSGWKMSNSTGSAFNLTKTLKQNKRRYVLNICASWCTPCLEGLQKIAESKQKFEDANISVVILVADSTQHGQEIFKKFSFTWAHVVVDEFKTFALRLAPELNKAGKESLSLPKTIIFNREGLVEMIIGQEGDDYIPLLLGQAK